MAAREKIWELREGDPKTEERLASSCGIPSALARVLVTRGIRDEWSVRAFLSPELSDMHDPFAMPDMDRSAARLLSAVEDGERIRVYGDYDVDGITSVSLMVSVLRALGADVDYHIPNRLVEGYGLSTEAIEKAAEDGVSLLITVDCGVSAIEEIGLASDLGIDVIVTDHHEAGDMLPSCVGVINPKRGDSEYPFRELAGVGVAFKLCQALWRLAGRPEGAADPHKYLDIVALGTIADVVPLQGENRIIARALPPTSFRFCLPTTPLSLANGWDCHPSFRSLALWTSNMPGRLNVQKAKQEASQPCRSTSRLLHIRSVYACRV
jgi:single-stranded-DNA-specific exonuclease